MEIINQNRGAVFSDLISITSSIFPLHLLVTYVSLKLTVFPVVVKKVTFCKSINTKGFT